MSVSEPSSAGLVDPIDASSVRSPGRALTEADAIEIWIARWLRIRRKDLVARYGCDPRRLYEVWWGDRFPGARAKANEVFRARYPTLVDRTIFGYRRIPRRAPEVDARQLLFDWR